jgi:hypothetical protein
LNIDQLKRLAWLAFLTTVSPCVVADLPDLDGRWVGKTTCPLGAVTFVIDLDGGLGTFAHGGYGPDKVYPLSFPVKVALSDGWEGQWIYFNSQDSNVQNSFAGMSALLSADGKKLDVRSSVSLGDCRGFQLTKSRPPINLPIVDEDTPSGAPDGREPSEDEMRQAVEYALHGDGEALEINNPLNGAKVSITSFDKLACVNALGRPGYTCDYTVSTGMVFHSNDGTTNGRKHAQAVNDFMGYLEGMTNAPKETAVTARFLYVKSKGHWVRLDE